MKPYTVEAFDRDIEEPFAWPGGCPRYFVCEDGEALSFAAARDNADLIREAIRTQDGNSTWLVAGCDVNWEQELFCSHTGEPIESAYDPVTDNEGD